MAVISSQRKAVSSQGEKDIYPAAIGSDRPNQHGHAERVSRIFKEREL